MLFKLLIHKYFTDKSLFFRDLTEFLAKSLILRDRIWDGGIEATVIIILMGVAGSGKSTIGNLLSQRLGWNFADADNFHSPTNIEKMRSGIPLTDSDREPWLNTLRLQLEQWSESGTNGILACSALKQSYRDHLRVSDDVRFVYLKGDKNLLQERLRGRREHYMKDSMLASQFATLEEPVDAVILDVSPPPAEIVEEIVAVLGLSR
jgi:gluconokinase